MRADTAVALGLAAVSTTLTNLAYLREHDAAASLPCLSMRRPLHSVALLLHNRDWMLGFVMETSGFGLYAAALALAPLALVQSIGAGGIGVLAFVSSRLGGQRLGARRTTGVVLAILGLIALAGSLARATGNGSHGSTAVALLWIGATVAATAAVLAVGRATGRLAIAQGLAGGLLFSIGDLSTKLATQGGARIAFALALIAGYSLGTSLLQMGYQRGSALTVAGLYPLCTNALPIAAGTIVLHEPVPSGALGVLRIFAFAGVVAGAILLAHPDPEPGPHPAARAVTHPG